MAALKLDLYGEIAGTIAGNPEWDDVIPIPHSEPDDALARIAYPDDYAEGWWWPLSVYCVRVCVCVRVCDRFGRTLTQAQLFPTFAPSWLLRSARRGASV